MFKHDKILWITRTAALIAITVVLQALTLQLGNQYITGSVVNLMLVLSVMTCGLPTGLTVASFSPILPTLLGFGPVWPVVPFIVSGNMVFVALWHYLGNLKIVNEYFAYIVAMIVGAVAKFLILYIGVAQLAMPFILGLPEKHVMSVLFSYPQLITASAGGILAIFLLPLLLKALRARQQRS